MINQITRSVATTLDPPPERRELLRITMNVTYPREVDIKLEGVRGLRS
jgi:hypothetical protein